MAEGEKILLVGEEMTAGDELAATLTRDGFQVARAGNGSEALRVLGEGGVDLVLSEWDLPDLGGGALLRRIRRRNPETVVLAAGPVVSDARRREMMRDGVEDYLEIPRELRRVSARVAAALARRGLEEELPLIGHSDQMREILAAISQVAASKVTVLIVGESGTGKELVARAIHQQSPRKNKPFVAVNCGALPPGVLESELFGHERGAFTGAVGERQGRFELAHQGTLFLDEVGELPPPTQVELLRVLEEEKFLRVGGTREVKVDVRILAATNRDLEAGVRDRSFRQDLYYRLRVVTLRVPPLRERPQDIPLLVEHFLRETAHRHQVPVPRVPPEVLQHLAGLSWPGNVRELRNVVDSLVILKRGDEITMEDLPAEVVESPGTPNLPLPLRTTREEAERELIYQSLVALRAEIAELRNLLFRDLPSPLPAEPEAPPEGGEWAEAAPPPTLAELEREAVRRALSYTGGNRKEAARLLGIGLRTLYRKLRRFGLG